MIILNSNGGQLCNKIWSYSPLIAHSLKHRTSLYIIDFDESVVLFENLNLLPKIHFVTNKYQKKILRLLPKLYLKFFPNVQFYYNNSFHGITHCIGWDFRSETRFLNEYVKELCTLFTPRREYVARVENFIDNIRNNNKLIGIHIRRQDYKTHVNGAYYYDNEVYYQIMLDLMLEIKQTQGADVSFLICSDEQIDLSYFHGLTCYQQCDAINIEDLYGLSLCDYIIGPPSTFSMWASFYGKVPLFLIASKHEKPKLDQFRIIEAVDKFVDGTSFTHSVEMN